MNPFNVAIESTRRPSAIYSPSTLNKMLHELHSPVDPHGSTTSRGIAGSPKSTDDAASEREDEVYALLYKLRQLIGDVDTQPILDQLRKKNEETKGDSTKIQSSSSENKQLKERKGSSALVIETETDDKNVIKPKLMAHFALTTPLVINDTGVKDHWQEAHDVSVGLGSVSVDQTPLRGREMPRTSRYSLGANRFSIRAKEISSDTLNYVNGSRLLRNTTRSSLMTPDPYAFLSPMGGNNAAKKHFSFETSVENTPRTPSTATKAAAICNFAEFCVIGVKNAMLNGNQALDNSSLQPTEVIELFPAEVDRLAIVGNLNEYCFPFGAELKFVTHSELEDLKSISHVHGNHKEGTSFHNSNNAFGLQFQIMQFTDANSVVYYATCVISPEPLEQVSTALQQNMSVLQNSVAAANTIKRYLAYYVHRKKQALNDELNAEWAQNMERSRYRRTNLSKSVGGTKSAVSSSVTAGSSSMDSKSSTTKSKSLFKTLKKVFTGSRRPTNADRSVTGDSMDSAEQQPNTNNAPALLEKSDSGSKSMRSPKHLLRVVFQPLGAIVASPQRQSSAGSPLSRQRSYSYDSPARPIRESDLVTSNLGAAQVLVDGSPLKTSSFYRKLDQSNRKVALVTQRAYCIISDKPMHALFFQVLEAIALKERDRALVRWSCMTDTSRDITPSCSAKDLVVTESSGPPPPRRGLVSLLSQSKSNSRYGLLCDPTADAQSFTTNSSHLVRRNEFLTYIQEYDFSKIKCMTDLKRAVSVPRNSAKCIELSLPSYIKSIKVSYKTLLLKEWTVAILIALIPSELIVKIHSLLLQEQSLLVYGSDAGMVTAVVTAFALLLQPFNWEGIYVPLLPTAAYEALDAPVPFVIGVVAEARPLVGISPSAGVLSLDDFIHYPEQYMPSCFDEATMRHTLASRDERHLRDTTFRRNYIYPEDGGEADPALKFFEAPCPEETSQGITPLLDPMQCSQLKELHQFVAYHAVKIRASLKFAHVPRLGPFNATSAIKAVMNDLSDEALRSLSHVLNRMNTYNTSICGEVLSQPGGWRQFGVLNSRSNQFEFLPDLFMAPLKAHLRLQESVINTQLFVSFMDKQSEDYFKLQPQRVFISEWVYFRMHRNKKFRKRPLSVRLMQTHTY